MRKPVFDAIMDLPTKVLLTPTQVTESLTSKFVEVGSAYGAYIVCKVLQCKRGPLTLAIVKSRDGLLESAVAINPMVWVKNADESNNAFAEIAGVQTFIVDGSVEEQVIVFGLDQKCLDDLDGYLIAIQVFDPRGLTVVKATILELINAHHE